MSIDDIRTRHTVSTDPHRRTDSLPAPHPAPLPTSADRAEPTPTGGVSRRVVSLGGIGLAAVSVGLAACSSPAQTAEPSESPTTDDGGTDASGGAAAAPIVALADIPVGGAVAVDVEGQPCIVSQPEAGSVIAFTAICTHQGCKVTPADAKLDCPCHGSQFDAFTGAVLRGPAEAPLTEVPVALDGDNVVKA